jgi:DNA-directed RNA polymerase specialized sigma24 family protein
MSGGSSTIRLTVCGRLGNSAVPSDDTEDVVQEVFLRAFAAQCS